MYLITFVIFLIAPLVLSSDIKEYECDKNDFSFSRCIVPGVAVTETDDAFTVKPPEERTIMELIIYNGKIPVWENNTMCETFENITSLGLINMKIKKIGQKTLQSCSKLESLTLRSNEIESIEPGTFISLVNLERLGLSANKLLVFQISALEGIAHLKSLDLDNNELFDFDEKSFAENYPNAKISLMTNNMRCDRIEKILRTFPQAEGDGSFEKKGNYTEFIVHNKTCLPTDKWIEQLGKVAKDRTALAKYGEQLIEGTDYHPVYEELFVKNIHHETDCSVIQKQLESMRFSKDQKSVVGIVNELKGSIEDQKKSLQDLQRILTHASGHEIKLLYSESSRWQGFGLALGGLIVAAAGLVAYLVKRRLSTSSAVPSSYHSFSNPLRVHSNLEL